MASISWLIAFFCVLLRDDHARNILCCSGVSSTQSPSAKNCASVMPNPLQMLSSVGMEGVVFRLKILEMVDWESPQFFASVYSDQFLSVRSLTISSRIFNLAHIPQYLQAYNSALYITCLKSLFRYFHWPSIYGWFYCRSRSFLLIGMCLFSFSS